MCLTYGIMCVFMNGEGCGSPVYIWPLPHLPPACPGAPTAPSLTIDTPPDVTVTWSLPSASSAWPLKYRVEWSNGTVLGDNLNTLSVVISGVDHVTQYSIVITALTNSSCTDEKVMFNFTTGQSEWVVGREGGVGWSCLGSEMCEVR